MKSRNCSPSAQRRQAAGRRGARAAPRGAGRGAGSGASRRTARPSRPSRRGPGLRSNLPSRTGTPRGHVCGRDPGAGAAERGGGGRRRGGRGRPWPGRASAACAAWRASGASWTGRTWPCRSPSATTRTSRSTRTRPPRRRRRRRRARPPPPPARGPAPRAAPRRSPSRPRRSTAGTSAPGPSRAAPPAPGSAPAAAATERRRLRPPRPAPSAPCPASAARSGARGRTAAPPRPTGTGAAGAAGRSAGGKRPRRSPRSPGRPLRGGGAGAAPCFRTGAGRNRSAPPVGRWCWLAAVAAGLGRVSTSWRRRDLRDGKALVGRAGTAVKPCAVRAASVRLRSASPAAAGPALTVRNGRKLSRKQTCVFPLCDAVIGLTRRTHRADPLGSPTRLTGHLAVGRHPDNRSWDFCGSLPRAKREVKVDIFNHERANLPEGWKDSVAACSPEHSPRPQLFAWSSTGSK